MSNKTNPIRSKYLELYDDPKKVRLHRGREELVSYIINAEKKEKPNLTPERRIFTHLWSSVKGGDIYSYGLYEAFSNWDMKLLSNVIYQYARHEGIRSGTMQSGADHAGFIFKAIMALAANDTYLIEKVFPKKIGLCNTSKVMAPNAANLIISLYYKNPSWLEKAQDDAKAFLGAKRDLLSKSIVGFLLAISEKDFEKASEDLKNVCVGTRREQSMGWSEFEKCFCVFAHGLYNFAFHVLPESEFKKIEMPDDDGFVKDFALWNIENNFPVGEYYLVPEEAELFKSIMSIDIPDVTLKEEKKNKFHQDYDDFAKQLTERVQEIQRKKKEG
ncbi:MAG: hypothetical protein FWD48_04520 [Oscillospiraceae bacterium]|nr:hypothetical protein [Oscillospiraceae bacterium]